jgi:hypothetical protein
MQLFEVEGCFSVFREYMLCVLFCENFNKNGKNGKF